MPGLEQVDQDLCSAGLCASSARPARDPACTKNAVSRHLVCYIIYYYWIISAIGLLLLLLEFVCHWITAGMDDGRSRNSVASAEGIDRASDPLRNCRCPESPSGRTGH